MGVLTPLVENLGINTNKNFVDSSPTNGFISYKPLLVDYENNPLDQNYGDTHFYYAKLDCEK